MEILRFSEGDVLLMKKNHPCGTARFKVLRCGSDVRIMCEGCGRDITVAREDLEKRVKSIINEEK